MAPENGTATSPGADGGSTAGDLCSFVADDTNRCSLRAEPSG